MSFKTLFYIHKKISRYFVSFTYSTTFFTSLFCPQHMIYKINREFSWISHKGKRISQATLTKQYDGHYTRGTYGKN